MNIELTFSGFLEKVDEEIKFLPTKSIILKRKYKDALEDKIGLKAPIRTKMLEFIGSKDAVSKQELDEFMNSIKEEKGKKPSWGWIRKNASLINKEIDEDHNISYSLTKRGKRILDVYKKFEEFMNIYNDKSSKDIQEENNDV